jgi:hypothetical protein
VKYSTEAPTSAAPPASPGLTCSPRNITADRKPNTGIRFSTIAAQPASVSPMARLNSRKLSP